MLRSYTASLLLLLCLLEAPAQGAPQPSLLSAPSNPTLAPVFNAIAGQGYLQPLTTNTTSCAASANVWITNVLATQASNGSVTVVFTIAGGSDGAFYDVFANAAPIPATNPASFWAWMGQGRHCQTYQLQDLPPTSAFLVLGAPQDSDHDGLTDAYELLVSHTNPYLSDSDYDGAGDGLEVMDGTNPLDPDSAPRLRLGFWSFDAPDGAGDQGQMPLYASSNFQFVADGWMTNALDAGGVNPARLAYSEVETNGNSNLNCRNGSIRFHFKPNWRYGNGPNDGRLIDVGASDSNDGWWALLITNHGTTITFAGQSNGMSATYLSAPLGQPSFWNSNVWYYVELSYSPEASSLYMASSMPDGGAYPLLAYGSGVLYYPTRAERTLTGFNIGSDKDGNHAANGLIDELETFNYPLDFQAGPLPGGAEAVPSGAILDMPGQRIAWDSGWACDLALSPDGATLYIKDINRLRVLDAVNWSNAMPSVLYPADPASMYGIAVSRDGAHVYVTGLENELYDGTFATNSGSVSLAFNRTINLPNASEPSGIALSTNGATAYVCLSGANALAVVDLVGGSVTGLIDVGVAPYAVALSPDEHRAYVSDYGGRVPGLGDAQAYAWGRSNVLVDSNGIPNSGAVSIVDLVENTEQEIPTGLHPTGLALSPGGATLYVANANSDTVTVIDTALASTIATISVRPAADLSYNGSAPNALALSPEGATLYVALGGNNAIAVINTADYQVLGFIPTDWYPGALAADSANLYVVNVRGLGLRWNQYYSALFYNKMGTADKIPIPSAGQLAADTARVRQNDQVPRMLATTHPPQIGRRPVPVPANVGEPSVFAHVFYIIKENKTYDQVFGDMPQGNGLACLCLFSNYVTPNQHALASQFVLLDNYYCNGVDSDEGHQWCTQGNATDLYVKKGSHRRNGYGADALGYSASGFIWDNALSHGLSVTNYGEFVSCCAHIDWQTAYSNYCQGLYPNGLLPGTLQPAFPNWGVSSASLQAITSPNFPGWPNNLSIPDQLRADVFIHDLTNADAAGLAWPAFTMMHLPNNHTSGLYVGWPTPSAEVADNDLALGRMLEALTRSRFWSNSVVFVIEDDPLSGYDHVDGHRSVCLVVSPYTKRRQTVSSFYSQTGVIHTLEQILGIPPMNQMDAMASLMVDCFTATPDFTPFTALSNNLPLDTLNPDPTSPPPACKLAPKTRYWAKKSMRLDFSKPDAADDKLLSRILWYSVRGDAPYPAEFTGAHGRGLKQLGLVLVKNQKDPDDD